MKQTVLYVAQHAPYFPPGSACARRGNRRPCAFEAESIPCLGARSLLQLAASAAQRCSRNSRSQRELQGASRRPVSSALEPEQPSPSSNRLAAAESRGGSAGRTKRADRRGQRGRREMADLFCLPCPCDRSSTGSTPLCLTTSALVIRDAVAPSTLNLALSSPAFPKVIVGLQ